MEKLEQLARRIRRHALMAIHAAESGHPGGCLSCADLLAVLWSGDMGDSLKNGADPARNRFILSKGHAAPALYAVAAEAGLIPRQELLGLRKLGHRLQGHPSVLATPWAETSSGSLGQGFSVALGLAMGLRYQGHASRVFVMLGDGEMQEGEVWEAAMCAAHHKLGQLTAIVDYNKMQSDALNEEILGLEPLADKWRAFGWRVEEIDGHDFGQITRALAEATEVARPCVVIAHTHKGKGVSFMENSPAWHGSVKLKDGELRQALEELGMAPEAIERYFTEGVIDEQ